MSYSSEIRWFFNSTELLKPIEDWFSENKQAFNHELQTEYYLVLPKLTTHGIKLREGNVEIKLINEDLHERIAGNNNTGKANIWTKYIFNLKKDDEGMMTVKRAFAGLRIIGINQDWIRIEKDRQLVKFAIDTKTKSLKKVSNKQPPEEGCHAELTELKINLQPAGYTFALECYGSNENLKTNLDLALKHIFASIKVSGLTKDQSLSYPEFLAKQKV
jgi:hypothetical protein